MERIDNQMLTGGEYESRYKVVALCDECGGVIYEGDYFYEFDGDTVCVTCEPDYVKEKFRRCID